VGQPDAVGRHDRDEVGLGVAHEVDRVGLETGRGVVGCHGLEHERIVGDRRGDGHALGRGFGVDVGARVGDEPHRRGGRQQGDERQLQYEEASGDAPAPDHPAHREQYERNRRPAHRLHDACVTTSEPSTTQ
jgi:hypothetical protein